jgi:hypothetical protein
VEINPEDVSSAASYQQLCSMAGLCPEAGIQEMQDNITEILQSGLQIPLQLRSFLGSKRRCRLGWQDVPRQIRRVLFELLLTRPRAPRRMFKRYGLYSRVEVIIPTDGVTLNLVDTAGEFICIWIQVPQK